MEGLDANDDERVTNVKTKIVKTKFTMSINDASTSGPHFVTICKSESGFLLEINFSFISF